MVSTTGFVRVKARPGKDFSSAGFHWTRKTLPQQSELETGPDHPPPETSTAPQKEQVEKQSSPAP